MPRSRTARFVLPVLAAGVVAVAAAGCGSSSDDTAASAGSTTPDTSTTTSSGPTTVPPVTPSVVGASAVPLVSGKQGTKPTVAKATAAAPTSLLSHDVITGTGATAAAGQTVTVQYTLVLYATGALVQSSYDTGQPFAFPLGQGQVIPGFDAGVVGMKVGGRRELIIPPALGYRDQASDGIPANSTLIFVVDLVSVG